MGGVERSILDILLKIEENKQKYLEMQKTILLVDEEETLNLSTHSHKYVSVVCPKCLEKRQIAFRDIGRTGHTLCRGCSRTLSTSLHMFGERYGQLTVVSYGEDFIDKDGIKKTQLHVICDCGNEFDVLAHSLKNGNTQSCGCYKVRVLSGENSKWFDPTLSSDDRALFRGAEHNKWARRVKRRDNFRCQICDSEKNLVAHHLNSYKEDEEMRFLEENGITLCRDCHIDFHINFMGGYKIPCTVEDFQEYLWQV